MSNNRFRFAVLAAVASLALLFSAAPAKATFELTIQSFNSSNTLLGSVVVDDGSGSDGNAAAGVISYTNGAFAGGFNLTTTVGTSKPSLTNAIDLSNVTVTAASGFTAGNYIVFTLSDQGFAGATGTGTLTGQASAHMIAGSGSMTFQSWIDRNNGLNAISGAGVVGTAVQGPFNMNPGVSDVTNKGFTPGPGSLFSMTSVTKFTPGGVGASISLDNTTSVTSSGVPAPAGLVLLLSGAPVLSVGYWLRRRKLLAA
jgi:hypothetical protein